MQKVLEFECGGSELVPAERVALKINLTINLSSLLKLTRQWSSLIIAKLRKPRWSQPIPLEGSLKLSFQ